MTKDGETYHDIPPIRAPHWRWLIITYFWLGGIAGGASAIAELANLFTGRTDIVRAGRYVSTTALLPAPVLLTLDLGRPDRFHHMFRVVKLKSPMSLGSWALLSLGGLSGVLALDQLGLDVLGVRLFRPLTKAMSALTIPFAFFVAGYTGILLAVTNVPVWAKNYLFLGPTFLASGFSSALAASTLFLRSTGGHPTSIEALERAETVTLVTEAALLGAGVVRLGSLGRPLTTGRRGIAFWLVTMCGGILTPIVLQFVPHRSGLRWLRPVFVLAGSFCMRATMVLAGHESANRPRDYFRYTSGSNS